MWHENHRNDPSMTPSTICFNWATPAPQFACLHGYWPIPHAKNKTDAPDTIPPKQHFTISAHHTDQTPRPPPSSSSSTVTKLVATLSLWGDICYVMMTGFGVLPTGWLYRLRTCLHMYGVIVAMKDYQNASAAFIKNMLHMDKTEVQKHIET